MLQHEINLLTRMKRESHFIEGLIRNDYRINNNIRFADRLHQCTHRIAVPTHENRLVPIYPCMVYACPLCAFFKNRKQIAQYHRIFNRLEQIPGLKSARFYLLTLTVKECRVESMMDTLREMVVAYDKLLGKVKQSVISSSRFLHYGINPDRYVHPHYHAILILRSGRYYVKHERWHQYWSECLNHDYMPHVNLLPLNPDGPIQRSHFVGAMTYGLKSLEFDQIKTNAPTFTALFNLARGIRRVAHRGLVKELKREVVHDYHRQRPHYQPTQEPTWLMRFDGNSYHQDRLLFTDEAMITNTGKRDLPENPGLGLVTD